MGNKSSKESTTLGHSLEPEVATSGTKGTSFRRRVITIFSIEAITKAFSVATKKRQEDNAMQMHQPPITPPATQQQQQAADLLAKSFAPLDFTDMERLYQVDWSDNGILGSGHYAIVYRGESLTEPRMVAVKKVSKKLTRIDSLKTEVEALRAVAGHRNIVQLFDVFLDSDHMYLVLELLGGGELFDRIVQSGAYSEFDAARNMKNIGSALQYMHSKGIVHRDLKPENLVLVDPLPDSEIKISDFGLSKMLKDDEEVMMTICGTKAYSAPEVGFGFRAAGVPRTDDGYSSKVDMWSLGVILYVIIAAYHPFDPQGADSDQVIWSRIVAGKWDFNDKVWETISDPLKDLLTKLIEVDPVKRLSADEFLAHKWINNAETPIRPLPSLTRNRSSRYWNVNTGNNNNSAFNFPKTPAATVAEEGEESEEYKSERSAKQNQASSSSGKTDHELV